MPAESLVAVALCQALSQGHLQGAGNYVCSPRSDPFTDEETEAQGQGSDLLRTTPLVRDRAETSPM